MSVIFHHDHIGSNFKYLNDISGAMLLNASENEKLFAKLVPVSLKDVYTNQSRGGNLFLTMEWQDAAAGMYSRKVLAISLTDNDDPFFLYNLHLSEEDFQMLKTNQDLLINFSSFPQHIIDYIENCLKEDRNPQPKYLLVFTFNGTLGNVASPAQLDIVETNQFKHLTHLSLKFVAASESAVKQYLVMCFKQLKEEKRQLQNNLTFLEQDLKSKVTASQHDLSSKQQELELLRRSHNAELSVRDNKHALELQEERDQLLNRLKEKESRFELEKGELEHKLRREIQQLESRVTVLDSLNKELEDKNYKFESTIRDLRSKVISLEDEIRRLKESIRTYKQKCDQLHSDIKDRKTRMRQNEQNITDMQQELQDKEQSIKRLKDLIESEKRSKKTLEADLEKLKFQLDMSEQAQKVLENDKDKLNRFLTDLQSRADQLTKEVKSKSAVADKYKKVTEEKDKALSDLKHEIDALNTSLKTTDDQVKELADSKYFLEKKLDALEKDTKLKDNVIKYLNRQLTENLIINQYSSPSNFQPSPSGVTKPTTIPLTVVSVKSPGQDPSLATTQNTVPKLAKGSTASANRKNGGTLRHSHATTDSAYCTFPSGYTNQETNEIECGSHDVNFDPSNFDVDPKALSAAFGKGNPVLKHSTEKKQKSQKSNTPKSSASKSNTPKR